MTLSELYKRIPGYSAGPFGMIPSSSNASSTPLFPTDRQLPNNGGAYQGVTMTPPAQKAPDSPVIHADYMNTDGSLLAPGDVVSRQAAKISTGRPDIPQFAGDQFSTKPQTTVDVAKTATGLNNTRNDIATGATDPYNAASKSGVAYSPEELKAIEKAYAGIYDPAISSALAKLDVKQKQDNAEIDSKRKMQEQIFATNENIRQWKETTGSKGSGGTFTPSQETKGASNAGLDIATFKAMDNDLKNFFINTPKGKDAEGKAVEMDDIFRKALQDVKDGAVTAEDIAKEISESNLPQAVKQYYLDQMPLAPEIKQGLLARIWGAITGN